jgi:hypothetical protein
MTGPARAASLARSPAHSLLCGRRDLDERRRPEKLRAGDRRGAKARLTYQQTCPNLPVRVGVGGVRLWSVARPRGASLRGRAGSPLLPVRRSTEGVGGTALGRGGHVDCWEVVVEIWT